MNRSSSGRIPEKGWDRTKVLLGVALNLANLLIEKLNEFIIEQPLRSRQIIEIFPDKATG